MSEDGFKIDLREAGDLEVAALPKPAAGHKGGHTAWSACSGSPSWYSGDAESQKIQKLSTPGMLQMPISDFKCPVKNVS